MYGLSDSDFAGCKDISRSITSYMIPTTNGGVVVYYFRFWKTIDSFLCTAMAQTIAQAKIVEKI
jgi:hypothetical protein